MKTKITLLLIIIASSFASKATTLRTEAGQLAEIAAGNTDATTLTLTGSMDASDFSFICDNLTSLRSLDLTGVTVTAYFGSALSNSGRTTSAAGVLPDYALAGTHLTELKLPATITAIGEAALAGCPVTAIEIPATVTEIGIRAFAGSGLGSVTLPATVSAVGEGAFRDITALTTVKWNSTAAVPAYCFYGDGSLSNFNITANVKEIGSYAFSGTTSLTEPAFPASLENIGNYAFAHSGITSLNLTECDGLEEIGTGAFENCTALTEAYLPEGLVNLPDALFFGDSALTGIHTGNQIKAIGTLSLAGTSSLAVTPLNTTDEGTATIGDYALSGAKSVTSVLLPSNLVSIGKGAMEGMTSLKEVDARTLNWVPELDSDVWKGTDQSKAILHVNENTADAFASTPQWNLFIFDRVTDSGVISPDEFGEFRTDARFDGNTLAVTANLPIAAVTIHDISGQLAARLTLDGETSANIDTEGLTAKVYIIEIIAETGEKAVFKLANR